MPLKFHRISFNASEWKDTPAISSFPMFSTMLRDVPQDSKMVDNALANKFRSLNDEHASRVYLQTFLLGMGNESMGEITSLERPELVPNFLLQAVNEVQLTKSKTIAFQQAEKSVPIFGAKAIIEIDTVEKSLVSIEANFSEKPDVSPMAELAPSEALIRLQNYCGINDANPQLEISPELVFFPDYEHDKWRLAYHFMNFPAFPPELSGHNLDSDDHQFCIRNSPRHNAPFHDYFVDAQNGEVFYYFSSMPRLDIPVQCNGDDDQLVSRSFYGLQNGGGILLSDPLRSIQTYDYKHQDIDNPGSSFPASPVAHPAPNFANSNRAAISAHYNATLVFDFFNNELKRNGIDDKGMILESVVNVYSSNRNPSPPPIWGNAVWWNKRMWYGQEDDPGGTRISFARFLDVIGHELTHGVTESSSNLIYRDLSGALNESFSDIFGILIKNWYPSCPNPIAGWNWEMGPGLGQGGRAIRNFQNPAICGQPDHYSQYTPLPAWHDNGGVHIYSGIHNLAAYKVLTFKDTAGSYVFAPSEVAILYYLTLTRLTRFSNFSDCRRTLLNVAGVYYSADPVELKEKQDAIKDAYNAVGII